MPELRSSSFRGISFWQHDHHFRGDRPEGGFRQFLHDNGITLVTLALFFLCLGLQIAMGWRVHNENLQQHQQAALGVWQYLRSYHFLEAVMENWESEFLQMGVFVVLTGHMFQRGSAESKDPDKPQEEPPKGPWIYEHSLSIALFGLYALSFVLHALGSHGLYNEDQRLHGEAAVDMWTYMRMPTFWFQSMQNAQSEFLSVAVLMVLSIFLRERGSSQSKPVDASDDQTGES